jgi:hypothetical protein
VGPVCWHKFFWHHQKFWLLVAESESRCLRWPVPFLSRDFFFSFRYVGGRVQDSIRYWLSTVTQESSFFRFPLSAAGVTCGMTCSPWWHISSHLSWETLMVGPRELFSMLRLDWRVHWKCQMSMPLSVGYRWLCADSALRGCYRKSCTRMGKSSGRGQSTKKTTSGRGQSFSNLVLFFRLPTNISTQIYYYRSWDGLKTWKNADPFK